MYFFTWVGHYSGRLRKVRYGQESAVMAQESAVMAQESTVDAQVGAQERTIWPGECGDGSGKYSRCSGRSSGKHDMARRVR